MYHATNPPDLVQHNSALVLDRFTTLRHGRDPANRQKLMCRSRSIAHTEYKPTTDYTLLPPGTVLPIQRQPSIPKRVVVVQMGRSDTPECETDTRERDRETQMFHASPLDNDDDRTHPQGTSWIRSAARFMANLCKTGTLRLLLNKCSASTRCTGPLRAYYSLEMMRVARLGHH